MTRRRAMQVVAAGAGLALSLFGAVSMTTPAAAIPAAAAAPSEVVPAVPGAAGAPTPSSGSTPITLPAGPGTGAPVAAAPTKLSARAKVAAVLGGLLLIGVLWAFSQGYGILGGHPRLRRVPPGTSAPDRTS